jgi:PAS domain-containing protein
MRDLDLRTKIAVVAVVPTALLIAVFLVVFAAQRSRVAGEVEAGMGRLAEENLSRAARDLRTLCEATHRDLVRLVPRALAVAHDEVARLGEIRFEGPAVAWRARNQLDGSVSQIDLPRLVIGDRWVAPNADFARRTPLVDRVRELSGADVTIFQRMNGRGDMLRVATTVRDASGTRAIGTVVPAIDPDGRPNPVVSTVLEGQRYEGRARVLDSWYQSAYEPIRDREGAVAGMLFIGLRQDSLESIRAGVAASRIGDSGVLYVLGATGNQRGRYLISPPGHADGEDAWSAVDARGGAFVRRIVEAGLSAPQGQTVQLTYPLPRKEGETRQRVAAVTYFAPWDWIIVAEVDHEEAVQPCRAIQHALTTAVTTVLAVALLLLLASVWVSRKAAARIAAPLESMAVAAERIAQGDLRQDVSYRGRDEVGRLAEAFRGTIGYLQEVARAAAALARGDLSTPLEPRSDRDELTQSFQAAQAELRRVVHEMRLLTGAAVDGRLGVRVNATRHEGEFRKILEGANATLSMLVQHLDAMPAPAMIVGPEFDIRYMNQTGASLLGKTPKELVGTKCYDSFCTSDCRTPRCASARAMAEDREVSSETDAHPEGLDLEIVYSSVPLHDEHGNVVGAFEIVSDQTAVKRPLAVHDGGPGAGRR